MDDSNVSVMTVTPSQAGIWLKSNPNNRSLSRSRVERLAGYMREGKFHQNGDTIRFDEDGALLDGQHRVGAHAAQGAAVSGRVGHEATPHRAQFSAGGSQHGAAVSAGRAVVGELAV